MKLSQDDNENGLCPSLPQIYKAMVCKGLWFSILFSSARSRFFFASCSMFVLSIHRAKHASRMAHLHRHNEEARASSPSSAPPTHRPPFHRTLRTCRSHVAPICHVARPRVCCFHPKEEEDETCIVVVWRRGEVCDDGACDDEAHVCAESFT